MTPLLLSLGLTLLANTVSAKTCHNATVEIPVSSRNGVFDKTSTPQSNFDAAVFALQATTQGRNGTQEALSGYATVEGTYRLSTQYCALDGAEPGALQILTHGIGFDKT